MATDDACEEALEIEEAKVESRVARRTSSLLQNCGRTRMLGGHEEAMA